MTNQKIYAANAWMHSYIFWLLSRSGCSSPSTKEPMNHQLKKRVIATLLIVTGPQVRVNPQAPVR